jgi:hypothetical protein
MTELSPAASIDEEITRIEAAVIQQNAVVQDIVRRKDFAVMPAAQQVLRQYSVELSRLRGRRLTARGVVPPALPSSD